MNPSTEPVLTATAVATLASVLMGALVAFGLPLTQEQRDSVKELVLVGFPIAAFVVANVIARSKVTPVAKLEEAYGEAAAQKLTRGETVVQ